MVTRLLLFALFALSTLLLCHCASPDNQWAETARATGVIIND